MCPTVTFNMFASLFCALSLLSEGGLAPNGASLELLVRGLGIVELSPETFEDRVLLRADAETNSAHIVSSWVVLFCKAGDTNCDQLAPSFEQLCLRMVGPSGDVRFGTLDCSRGASSEALCAELAVEAYPAIKHYQNGKNVDNWTSEKKIGLFPWLHNALHGTDKEKGSSIQSVPPVHTKSVASKRASTADHLGHSLSVPFVGISHLKYLHEYTLMEDGIFPQLLSGVLLAVILGKCSWILVIGAELWPSLLHASSRSSDSAVLY